MERFLSLLVSRAVGGARISTGVDAIWQVIVRDNIHASGAPVHDPLTQPIGKRKGAKPRERVEKGQESTGEF